MTTEPQTRVEAVAEAIEQCSKSCKDPRARPGFNFPETLAQAAIKANDAWLAQHVDDLARASNRTMGGICMDYGNNRGFDEQVEWQAESCRTIVQHILTLMSTEPRPSPEEPER